MKTILIPKKYVRISKEKEHPTAYVMAKKTGLLRGRIIKGDTRKAGNIYGPFGRTRVIRMNKNYMGFEKGEVIGRTKKIYPNQPNSTLVRTKTGSLRSIRVERHNRRSKKGKRHIVKKYKRSR